MRLTYEQIENVLDDTMRECANVKAENAKLRDALMALMVGTFVELCNTRDAAACKECSMRRDNVDCAVTEAMELLGTNSYCELMKLEGK